MSQHLPLPPLTFDINNFLILSRFQMWKIRMGGRREQIFHLLSVPMDTGSLYHKASVRHCACSRASKEKKRTELGSGLTGLRESRKGRCFGTYSSSEPHPFSEKTPTYPVKPNPNGPSFMMPSLIPTENSIPFYTGHCSRKEQHTCSEELGLLRMPSPILILYTHLLLFPSLLIPLYEISLGQELSSACI